MRANTQSFTYRNPEWPVSVTVKHLGDESRIEVHGEVPVYLHEDFAAWLLPIQQDCSRSKRTIITTSSGVVVFAPFGDGEIEYQVVQGQMPLPAALLTGASR